VKRPAMLAGPISISITESICRLADALSMIHVIRHRVSRNAPATRNWNAQKSGVPRRRQAGHDTAASAALAIVRMTTVEESWDRTWRPSAATAAGRDPAGQH